MITFKERAANKINTPDADEKTLFLDTDGNLKLKDQSGDLGYITISETLPAPRPKVYKALLSQQGTNAPVAIVLENTLGSPIEWQRINVGQYTSGYNLLLQEGKTLVYYTRSTNMGATSHIYHFPEDLAINIVSFNINNTLLADGILGGPFSNDKTTITIEVYP